MKDLRRLEAEVRHQRTFLRGQDVLYLGGWATLQLSLDSPWQARPPELLQNHVVTEGIDILGIDQKTVHVKQACTDFWKAGKT